jgi:carbonic anhydrase
MGERGRDALARLKAGNDRYVADRNEHPNLGGGRRSELVGGQDPCAVVLTCADSRVASELIFDVGLGDLFIARVAGNVLSPEIIGTIEYAALHLGTPLVIVMGHQGCGAVTAAVAGEHFGNSIDSLIDAMQDSVGAVAGMEGDLVDNCIRRNAVDVCTELLERSPGMAQRAADGSLMILPAYYALGTGEVTWL